MFSLINNYERFIKSFKYNFSLLGLVTAMAFLSNSVSAQDLIDMVDMSTPAMTEAQMTRDEVVAILEQATETSPADFTKHRLSGLDLSGLNFKRADMRWARLNNSDLSGSIMRGVNLDLAWMVGANLENVDMTDARLFSAPIQRANLKNAILDGARVAANFKQSDLRGASFRNADMSADMKNQSMGLMGTVMTSAKADGADFTGANMSRLNAEFAKFKNAILDNADLSGAKLGGSDLTGASVKGLILNNTDVDSARLLSLKNEESIVGLDPAINLNKARRE